MPSEPVRILLPDAWPLKNAFFTLCGYKPHAAQKLVHKHPARFRIVAAGNRFGKTTLAAMEAAYYATIGPTWVCSTVYGNSEITFEQAVHALERAGVKLRRYERRAVILDEKGREKVDQLSGRPCYIAAKSSDHPETLQGETLTMVVFDEAQGLKEDIWWELYQRIKSTFGKALLIGTPNSASGFFADKFNQGIKGHPSWSPDTKSWRFSSRILTCIARACPECDWIWLPEDETQEFKDLPADWRCPQCGTPKMRFERVIKHLSPAVFAADEANMTAAARAQRNDAEFVDVSGLVFPLWRPEVLTDPTITRNPNWPAFGGIDFGGTTATPAAIECFQVNPETGEVQIFDEFYAPAANSTLASVAKSLMEKWDIQCFWRDPESATGGLEFAKQGIPCYYPKGADRLVHTRIERIQLLLEQDKLRISPRCPNILKEGTRYSYKVPRTGEDPVTVRRKYDHGISAFGYAWGVLAVRPALWKKEERTVRNWKPPTAPTLAGVY